MNESHGNKIVCTDYMHVRSARYHVIYLLFPKKHVDSFNSCAASY